VWFAATECPNLPTAETLLVIKSMGTSELNYRRLSYEDLKRVKMEMVRIS
jgi:hypothetical protein